MNYTAAFLSLIGLSEGATYDMLVTGADGKHETFSSYAQHPFENRPATMVRPGLYSTAAGRYQIILPTWHGYQHVLGLKDFSPTSQDAVAVALIRGHGALDHLASGDVQTAIRMCAGIWASLPGSPYGQPTHSLRDLLAVWQNLIKE